MKHLSFRVLAICILLPPICYGFTIQALEHYLSKHYTREIEEVSTGDVESILAGNIRLQTAFRANIDGYLQSRKMISWGAGTTVLITAGRKTIVYPSTIEESDPPVMPENAMTVASENFALLNDGLAITVEVKIGFYKPISISILAGYILLSMVGLFLFYRAGLQLTEQEDHEREQVLQRLLNHEKDYQARMAELHDQHESVSFERDRLKKKLADQKAQASNYEAQLFEEIVQLDETLSQNLSLQTQQKTEMGVLREKISGYEKLQNRGHRRKSREEEILGRRFKALYKHILVHEKAIEGFSGLTDDMKIKGEEIINRLNEVPDQVPIKRKVFGKKGRQTVW